MTGEIRQEAMISFVTHATLAHPCCSAKERRSTISLFFSARLALNFEPCVACLCVTFNFCQKNGLTVSQALFCARFPAMSLPGPATLPAFRHCLFGSLPSALVLPFGLPFSPSTLPFRPMPNPLQQSKGAHLHQQSPLLPLHLPRQIPQTLLRSSGLPKTLGLALT